MKNSMDSHVSYIHKKSSEFWALLFLISTLVLSTFYNFKSGIPQPGHLLMLVSSVAILIGNKSQAAKIAKINIYGAGLLAWITSVDLFYAVYLKDINFALSVVYWIYGFLILGAAMVIINQPVYKKIVKILIGLSLIAVLIAYVLGLGGYTYWPRYQYFFNGPNQLAYFVICTFVVFVALDGTIFSAGFYFIYALSTFLIVATGGRSAYVGLVSLIVLCMYLAFKRWKHWILLLAIPVVVHFLYTTFEFPHYVPMSGQNVRVESGEDVSSITIKRISDLNLNEDKGDKHSIKAQFLARGYMRFIDYPEYMLFGAGQARDDRFENFPGEIYEIHSSLFALLFYYGILGLFLFSCFVYKLFREKQNLIILLPIFSYGLFTYGLRSPYFWFALGVLSMLPSVFKTESR